MSHLLFHSSRPFFDLPIGADRFFLVARHVLALQIAVVVIDVAICIFLRRWFLRTDTTTDPTRTTRKSRSMTSCSLLTSDYPGRWFLLHAVWNAGIVIACLPDVWTTLLDPGEACRADREYNLFPTLASMALHLYHCAAPWFWSKFTMQDFYHHIVFAIGGLGGLSVLWPWGPGANFAFLWLTGLPGGLDYLLLGLVKMGVVDRMHEKSINSWVNAWVRGPGCVVASAWTYAAWRKGKIGVPTAAVLLNVALIFCNGNYYSRRVVANEARCRALSTSGPSPTKGTEAKSH